MINSSNYKQKSILELRKKLGLTQIQFGELLRIPTRTIENWEQGTTQPKEYQILFINLCIQNNLLKGEHYGEKNHG